MLILKVKMRNALKGQSLGGNLFGGCFPLPLRFQARRIESKGTIMGQLPNHQINWKSEHLQGTSPNVTLKCCLLLVLSAG